MAQEARRKIFGGANCGDWSAVSVLGDSDSSTYIEQHHT